MALNSPKLILF